MSPEAMGVLAGTCLGLLNFVFLRWLAVVQAGPRPLQQQTKRADMLRLVALIDLMVLPSLGYVLGPLVFN